MKIIKTRKKKGSKNCPFKILFRKRGITFALHSHQVLVLLTFSMDDIETTLQLITLLSVSEKQTTLNIVSVKPPPQNIHSKHPLVIDNKLVGIFFSFC